MNKREKVMLYTTVLLLIVLVCKSLFWDEVKVTGDELKVKKFVELAVKENPKYNNFFVKNNLVTYKVTSISKLSDKEISPIRYEENNKFIDVSIKGKYKAKVTGYFLRIMPFKKISIETNTQK